MKLTGDSGTLNPMTAKVPLPPDLITAKVDELQDRIDAAEQELERLRVELEWWETGRRLFGEEAEAEEESAQVAEPSPAKPSEEGKGEDGTPAAEDSVDRSTNARPTLREALLTILQEQPNKTWPNDDMLAEMERRGWMPSGKNAQQHVRSMLAEMHRKGQARRVGHGRYRAPRPTPTKDAAEK